MKSILFILTAAFALLTACGDPAQRVDGIDKNSPPDVINTSGQPPSNSATDNIPDTVKRCYLYAKNRDTIYLKVLQTGKGITGSMKYDFYEKDGSHGVINGTAIGDTLVVDYTFQAEGTVSTAQRILIRQTSGYALAIGDMKTVDNKEVYTDRSKIKPGPIVLNQVDCTDTFDVY